ncbi:hypothetical protein [Methylosinus sp. sav-2]|uniref:hypothetical protein n=1 Tax=Methylosinus sp. sav-2 TaxID=2485168 RepID=UPI001FD94411|nr:hypothetical protein [Methylosinus sp. sav-2]
MIDEWSGGDPHAITLADRIAARVALRRMIAIEFNQLARDRSRFARARRADESTNAGRGGDRPSNGLGHGDLQEEITSEARNLANRSRHAIALAASPTSADLDLVDRAPDAEARGGEPKTDVEVLSLECFDDIPAHH